MSVLLISLFGVLTSFILGIFVIYKNPKSRVNRTFGCMSVLVSLWVLFNILADNSSSLSGALLWSKAAIVPAAFFGSSLLFFSFIFPEDKFILHKKLAGLLIVPPLIVLILSPTSLNIENVEKFDWGTAYTPGHLYTFLFVYMALFLGLSLFNFVKNFRSAKGARKEQFRYLLYGTATLVLVGLITNVVLPLAGFSQGAVFGPLSALIFIVAVSYSIVAHRLLDIEVIIRRSLVYSTLLASMIGMYSVLIFGLNRIFLPGSQAAFPRITDIIAIIIVALTIDPLKRVIENTTDRIFFKARYNSQETLRSLSESLVSVIDLKELVGEMRKVLQESVKVSKIAIYAKSDHHYEPVGGGDDFKKLDLTIEKKFFLSNHFQQNPELLVTDEIRRQYEDSGLSNNEFVKAVKFLADNGVAVVAPLSVKGELKGALFLGEKLSQDIYSNEDLRFIDILSHQAALAFENARLYEEQKQYGVRLEKEVKRQTKDLADANERLKELDQLKDEFMSIASHELRTPMTAIKSYVWLALHGRAGKLDAKLQDYLDKVYSSSERMIALINDMLNVSRIETGRLQIDIRPVSIQKVTEQVFGDLQGRSTETGVKLVWNKDTLAPSVMADPDKLAEIFTNLIGNSLKFTKPGGSVTVSMIKKDQMVEVKVSDTGVGIAKENMSKLFQKYGKLGDSYATMSASAANGTGLGLYITKQYIEKMGGKITVESTLGKCTTFTFTLPIATEKDLKTHQETTPTPQGIFINPAMADKFGKSPSSTESQKEVALPTKKK